MSLWTMGHGTLTKNGQIRSYKLGKWLRNRYGTFLSETYSPKDFYIRSTDVDRTLMSSAMVLAGLYPPEGSQVWNEDVKWQPIAIHTVPKELDRVLYIGRHGIGRHCKKYKKLYDLSINSDFFKSINEQYANFYQQVSKLTGWNVTDVHYFGQLQSSLYTYSNYDASLLPPWAKTIDYDKVNYLAGLNYARYTFTRELKRLSAGPFFNYLIEHFEKYICNTSDMPKFLMLMAHESTVAGILNSMDLFDYKTPEFGATVIWELRKNRRNHFVNIFYKKSGDRDAVDKLKMKDCGFDCNFEEFKRIMSPVTENMTDWARECDKP